jgi:tetratricopeptide (TPR) repeat protein
MESQTSTNAGFQRTAARIHRTHLASRNRGFQTCGAFATPGRGPISIPEIGADAAVTALLAAFIIGYGFAQSLTNSVPVSAACVALEQTVLIQIANGKLDDAERRVSAVLDSGSDDALNTCAGLVLNDMAMLLSVLGRIADVERLAARSVVILEKTHLRNDPALLRPLQILATARLEGGKTASAREALKRMQTIPTQRPEDRALVHATAAPFLVLEGKRPEAEVEYLAAIHALEEAGRSETADMAAILDNVGSLYIHEQRLTEADQVLDRASSVLSHAQAIAPMDRIKHLNIRGVLKSRQGDWGGAERDLRDALSMAEREQWVEPFLLRSILESYAAVLRRTHRRQDARSIEARAAAIQIDRTNSSVVDITELLSKVKPAKK